MIAANLSLKCLVLLGIEIRFLLVCEAAWLIKSSHLCQEVAFQISSTSCILSVQACRSQWDLGRVKIGEHALIGIGPAR